MIQTIYIDAREAFRPQHAGKGRYARSLIKALAKTEISQKVVLLTDKNSRVDIKLPQNWEVKKISGSGLIWQLKTGLKLRGKGLLVSPTSYLLPWLMRTPSLVFVHDLISFIDDKTHNNKARLIERFCLPRLVKNKQINFACVSGATAEELHKQFPQLKEERIMVAAPGKSKKFTEHSKNNRRRADNKKQLLAVGTLIPRKNIDFLIRAFDQLLAKWDKFKDYQLHIVGAKGWQTDKIFTTYQQLKHKNQIKFLGYLTDKQLIQEYRAAEAFILPSKYEGFGLPLLEATQFNCPVVCSDIPVFNEVMGEGALYFDPNSTDDLCNKLFYLLGNQELKEVITSKSKRQHKNYSWQTTSAKVVDKLLTFAADQT